MSIKARALVVDDDEGWREELSEALEKVGVHVDTATTAAEMDERLQGSYYHLLVLDIQLDPNNEQDVAGMTALKDMANGSLSRATKVIIVSGHATPDFILPAAYDLKVAYFVPKDTYQFSIFQAKVREILAGMINLDLKIIWQNKGQAAEAVLQLGLGANRVESGKAQQEQLAGELEDLLCRLFRDVQSVIVRPIYSGYSGAGILRLRPFYHDAAGHQLIVKFGKWNLIDEEYVNFKKYISPFVGGGRNTGILGEGVQWTAHLGGIVYTFLGAANDELLGFGDFYVQSKPSKINKALNNLFLDTCKAWYSSPGREQPYDLGELYRASLGFSLPELEKICQEQIQTITLADKLSFQALAGDGAFSNPFLAYGDLNLIRPTYMCITHSDFNARNILIDREDHTWLIDYQGTGRGHILRDVARLDSVVRFELLPAEEASLEDRLQLEMALCSVDRFTQITLLAAKPPTGLKSTLAKSYTTVVRLRSLASKLVPQSAGRDLSEYYIALLHYALNTLRYDTLAPVQREHALLSASLLTDWLQSHIS
jgi:CheY-like chemotaxis protein